MQLAAGDGSDEPPLHAQAAAVGLPAQTQCLSLPLSMALSTAQQPQPFASAHAHSHSYLVAAGQDASEDVARLSIQVPRRAAPRPSASLHSSHPYV